MNKLLVIFLFTTSIANAADPKSENMLATGQGISYPTKTSNVWYSNGRTTENPVGAMYQDGIKLAIEYIKYNDNEGFGDGANGIGVEGGFGSGDMGLAVGMAQTQCDGCDSDSSLGATAGFSLSDIGVGIGYHEDVLTAGFIFNATGKHRFGVMADSSSDDANKYTSLGLGYSYVGSKFNFTVDASKRDTDGASDDANKVLFITPAMSFKADNFQVSLNYDMDMNDDSDAYDSDFWLGVGFKPLRAMHLAVYADYVGDWSLVGTFDF